MLSILGFLDPKENKDECGLALKASVLIVPRTSSSEAFVTNAMAGKPVQWLMPSITVACLAVTGPVHPNQEQERQLCPSTPCSLAIKN